MNKSLELQINSLRTVLGQSPIISEALKRAELLDLPSWYLSAGCISQTVWNHISGMPHHSHIKDLDLAYFDPDDLSYEAESQLVSKCQEIFDGVPIMVDLKNQARVHIWHEEHFGYAIRPYRSVEDAINSWPTTATCVGVRYLHGEFEVYAPYGLNDLFGMTIKPNKVNITEDIYIAKVTRWKDCWPQLDIVPW